MAVPEIHKQDFAVAAVINAEFVTSACCDEKVFRGMNREQEGFIVTAFSVKYYTV
jgi:hypothetical protein